MAAMLRNPFSQKTLLFHKVRQNTDPLPGRATHAVRLFTKVIFAKANKSAFAPALKRSEK